MKTKAQSRRGWNAGADLADLRQMHAIVCEACGAAAEKRDPRARYCTEACAQKARRERARAAGGAV